MMLRCFQTSFVILLTIGLCETAAPAAPSATTAPSAPIANAAEKADWPRVRALLADGAGANGVQADGATALHWAAYHDNVNTVNLLLAAGASATAENRYGVTPLSLACINGNAE